MIIPAQNIQPAIPIQQQLPQSQIGATQPTQGSTTSRVYTPTVPEPITVGGHRMQMLSRPPTSQHEQPQQQQQQQHHQQPRQQQQEQQQQRRLSNSVPNICVVNNSAPHIHPQGRSATRASATTATSQQCAAPSNIDITNLVQTISIEPYCSSNNNISSGGIKTCVMRCGSTDSSKGSDRLVTDSGCGHTVCLTCLMKSPKMCPFCAQLQEPPVEHKYTAPKKDIYECAQCEKKFKRGGDLVRHERLCHGVNSGNFTCPTCKKSFLRAFDLKRHTLIHTSEKKYECGKCGAKFNRCENMKRHLLSHSGLKPYQCGYCKKEFAQQENLKRHILSHTGEQQRFRCSECKKDFTRLASLRRHEHSHTGTWPYTCVECEPHRGFSEPGLYKKHRLTHKGIKPYVCKVCNKGFNNPKAYRNHRRVHTGERPYVCQVCTGTFSQWGHLKRHKKVHEREAPGSTRKGGVRPHWYKHAWRKRYADPGRPKLPLSPYFLWFMDARERILKANPQLKMPELAKAGGRLWKTVNTEEKQFYERKAEAERQKYKELLERYLEKKSRSKVAFTTDVCVGTDPVLANTADKHEDSAYIEPPSGEEKKYTADQTTGNFSETDNRNLLESASRSVGLLPEAYSRDVTTSSRDYDSRDVISIGSGGEYDPYRSTYASRSTANTGVNYRQGYADSSRDVTTSSRDYDSRDVTTSRSYDAFTNRFPGAPEFPSSEFAFGGSSGDILDFQGQEDGTRDVAS